MSTNKEGLENLSVYTEMWVKRVFPDFYNLATYAVSPTMIKIRNEGFKKLLKQEIESQDKEYVSLVNYLTHLELAILEIRKECEKGNKNKEWNMDCFNEYFDTYIQLIKLVSSKMFNYGAEFGIEINGKSVEEFKW